MLKLRELTNIIDSLESKILWCQNNEWYGIPSRFANDFTIDAFRSVDAERSIKMVNLPAFWELCLIILIMRPFERKWNYLS
ncbi:MAG TPA: hypothetical protein DIW31_05955 [Bacteroidales bacterium]|nr:hypothetical protein [Bacteroidales bacterium]